MGLSPGRRADIKRMIERHPVPAVVDLMNGLERAEETLDLIHADFIGDAPASYVLEYFEEQKSDPDYRQVNGPYRVIPGS